MSDHHLLPPSFIATKKGTGTSVVSKELSKPLYLWTSSLQVVFRWCPLLVPWRGRNHVRGPLLGRVWTRRSAIPRRVVTQRIDGGCGGRSKCLRRHGRRVRGGGRERPGWAAMTMVHAGGSGSGGLWRGAACGEGWWNPIKSELKGWSFSYQTEPLLKISLKSEFKIELGLDFLLSLLFDGLSTSLAFLPRVF